MQKRYAASRLQDMITFSSQLYMIALTIKTEKQHPQRALFPSLQCKTICDLNHLDLIRLRIFKNLQKKSLIFDIACLDASSSLELLADKNDSLAVKRSGWRKTTGQEK